MSKWDTNDCLRVDIESPVSQGLMFDRIYTSNEEKSRTESVYSHHEHILLLRDIVMFGSLLSRR